MNLRCNGREALMLLVEHDHGFHQEFTEEDIEYLREQRKGLYFYLRKQGKTEEEVKDIFQGIREDTIFEITHEWQEAFLIGRSREDLTFEINPALALEQKPQEELFNADYECEELYQARIEATADRNAGKNTNEYWARARNMLKIVDSCLTELEAKYPEGSQVSVDHREFLQYLTLRLRFFRGLYRPWEETKYEVVKWTHNNKIFTKKVRIQKLRSVLGDGIWISASMWKGMQNRINRLLGSPKRYITKQVKETAEEILEVPGLVVYGLDPDRFVAEEEPDSFEEE